MGEPDETPHYHGHRERLRARFLEAGAASLADYELLELLLFSAIPRRDVKPLAKALIQRFGGFAGVINAEPAALLAEPGISEATMVMLKAIQATMHRVLRAETRERTVLTNWQSVLDYCRALMGHNKVEEFRLLFLDRRNALIADELQATGTIDHAPVYPREVVKRALDLGASAIIMVHNHPSGDTTPSRADIEITKAVAEAAGTLGIQLHDHLIVGGRNHASFRALGLI
jgi:DNA repair protein RadC